MTDREYTMIRRVDRSSVKFDSIEFKSIKISRRKRGKKLKAGELCICHGHDKRADAKPDAATGTFAIMDRAR